MWIEFPGESITRKIDRTYLPKPNYTSAHLPAPLSYQLFRFHVSLVYG